ncbi:anti-anti-sigma factor [Chloroflexus islandicus]|uniref:Anti-anti-sigma factor n=1 Tax=Chloroflexus islandicus TaxID=1707952 RepID=A0A178M2Y9_9CHLR|nr:STAS domain-containing protein [Chloroflexus islandicus]OAN41150.1 anti-anti-sigma factor [Chloroflexus islandicus]
MTTVFTELQDFLLARRAEMLAELAQSVQRQSAGYARLAQEELLPTMSMTIEALAEAIGNQDLLPFIAHAEALGEMRAYEGFMLTDVLVAVNIFRNLTWDALEDFAARQPACTIEIARIVEDMIGQFKRAMVTSFSQTYNQLYDQLRDQAEQIVVQQETIRELSTPILPLYQDILVLPLIGAIDSSRAGQMMERLLTAIAERQSDIVIIDITGVPVIDTAVANYLLQTARAAQLIGAQVILVGIGPEIAQTIVQLGVDLSGIAIGANLQNGIELALRRLGKQIRQR